MDEPEGIRPETRLPPATILVPGMPFAGSPAPQGAFEQNVSARASTRVILAQPLTPTPLASPGQTRHAGCWSAAVEGTDVRLESIIRMARGV
jgi:hypothetical protein